MNTKSAISRARQVEVIADELVHRLGAAKTSRPFFCKVAWRLTEARIWTNYEAAQKANNPIGLFIWLCKRDGV